MQEQQGQKKLNEIRKEVTPGNDEDTFVFNDSVSEEQWSDQEPDSKNKDELQENKKKEEEHVPRENLKTYTHEIDPKFYKIIHKLFRRDIRTLINEPGFIRFESNKKIKISYSDQKMLDETLDKVVDFVDSIQIMQMRKKDVSLCFQLSYKYINSLEKQGITIVQFKNRYNHEKEYFIGGRVSKATLDQKLLQMKNTNFQWVILPKFKNTRSYRAILRVIFQREQLRKAIKQKFNAVEIEVAKLLEEDTQKKEKKIKSATSMKIVLKIEGHKKIQFSQIQQFLSDYIFKNYLLVCLCVKPPQYKQRKWVEKFQSLKNIDIFRVIDRYWYQFIIMNDKQSKEKIDQVIEQIQKMNLNIVGKRYFNGFRPEFNKNQVKQNHLIAFPQKYPYSYAIHYKEGTFSWKIWLRNVGRIESE